MLLGETFFFFSTPYLAHLSPSTYHSWCLNFSIQWSREFPFRTNVCYETRQCTFLSLSLFFVRPLTRRVYTLSCKSNIVKGIRMYANAKGEDRLLLLPSYNFSRRAHWYYVYMYKRRSQPRNIENFHNSHWLLVYERPTYTCFISQIDAAPMNLTTN